MEATISVEFLQQYRKEKIKGWNEKELILGQTPVLRGFSWQALWNSLQFYYPDTQHLCRWLESLDDPRIYSTEERISILQWILASWLVLGLIQAEKIKPGALFLKWKQGGSSHWINRNILFQWSKRLCFDNSAAWLR